MNKEGEIFCDFLIDTNCCIPNGRNYLVNDYTFVGPQGSSVVDYCIIPYEALDRVTNFNICLEKNLFNRPKLVVVIDPNTSQPDHSLLTWDVKLETGRHANAKSNKDRISYVKFSRTYPPDFLQSCSDALNNCIDRIDSEISSQNDLDEIYEKLVSLVKNELLDKVEHKEIKLNSGSDNKQKQTKIHGGAIT